MTTENKNESCPKHTTGGGPCYCPGSVYQPAPVRHFSMIKAQAMKPIFIPLYTEHYLAFADGSKTDELRLYGPRWNEAACPVGRAVVLSKGYGKHARLRGRIVGFKRRNGYGFDVLSRSVIMSLYGSLDVDIACINIELDR